MNIERILDTVDNQIDDFDDIIMRMESKYKEEFHNSVIAKENSNIDKALMFVNTCKVIRENINNLKDTKFYYQQVKLVFEMLNERILIYKSMKKNNALIKRKMLDKKQSRELTKNLNSITQSSSKLLNELNNDFGNINDIVSIKGNNEDLEKLITDLNKSKVVNSDKQIKG
jgi:hypothetical protein